MSEVGTSVSGGSPGGDRGSTGSGALHRWLVVGPDPVEPDEPTGLLEVLLPWPVRCVVVGALVAAAAFWDDTGLGQQVAWGLQIGALVLVGIVTSFWLYILAADSGVALLWLLPLHPPGERRARWNALHVITFVNRQLEHIVALVVWILVALASWARLSWQVGVAASVLLLGPPLVNGLARTNWVILGPDDASKSNGGLFWRRRVLIYLATTMGLAALALRAPGQLGRILPLIASFGGGVLIRYVRRILRNRAVRGEPGASDMALARARFRQTQANAARVTDPIGPLFVVGLFAALVGVSFWQRQQLDDTLRPRLDGSLPPTDTCARDPFGPTSAQIALFIVSDAQTHELAGQPFPGQMDLSEALVHTASRPLPLEMLSMAPVKQFASAYATLSAARAAGTPPQAPMLWAHLGDLADLACNRELARMTDALQDYAKVGPLAGIAIGNHDATFDGSFHWNPYWDQVCESGRLEKDEATQQIADHFGRLPGEHEFVRLGSSIAAPGGGSLDVVTPLGIASDRGGARGVIGVFLDTSDGRAFDWGMPGSIGAISKDQLDAAREAIGRLRAKRKEYADGPAYVLFGHVPFDQLAGASRDRLTAFVTELDDRKGDLGAEPSVLALISAHTHVAASHRHCVGNRTLREIVVGSTIDPPEQASVVEIGPDARGRLSLSLRTLQSVGRPGLTCGPSPVVSSTDCRRVAAALRAAPECGEALGVASGTPPRDCQDLERPTSLGEELAAVRTSTGPRDIVREEWLLQNEARGLLACVCRDNRCKPGADPLTEDAFVATLGDVPAEHQTELTCLAWAAAATQAHKGTGMTLGEGLRCAFDDPTAPAEQVSVATLEAATCF